MIEIPLSSRKYQGLVALVDDEDAELVAGYSWSAHKEGQTFYAIAHVPGCGSPGQSVKMHRLIRPDIKGEIDHRDRNGLNNTRTNLRPATRSQQNANQGIRCDNRSGYKGVNWDKARGKWRVRVAVNGRDKTIGRFDDLEEAVRVRDDAARELHGDFAFVHQSDVTRRLV
jgi:hypothetical protein